MSERTIKVDYLARVEGEGAMTIRYRGDAVEHVALRIFEPPRFFEAFLRGRSCLEAPDITARICGICPVAYQMSACQAIEDALGVSVPPEISALRRLIYCGEWIESHVLHMVMLHAPDFLNYPDAMSMAREHGPYVRDGLRIKKAGNGIVALLGGREIHPINVKIGGFYRLPKRRDLRALADELAACRPLAERLVRWMSGFEFPALDRDYAMVALRPPDGPGAVYPFAEGPVVARSPTSSGGEIDTFPAAFSERIEEHHVARSNALHARLKSGGGPGGAYLSGPIARLELNFDRLPAPLRGLAREIGAAPPVRDPFRSLLVRGIEVLYALEEAERICRSWAGAEAPAVEVSLRAGVGHGCTEAPRGTLYHRYALDEQGLITEATIIPPTSQNQAAIEADLWAIAPSLLALDLEAATARAEQTIRNYDPCISCSTHFLTLRREELP